MKTASRTLLAATLFPVLAGCGDSVGRSPVWPDTANDLAVVRNDRPGKSTPVWRLPLDSASLVLGDGEGGDDYFVNVGDVLRLSDGRTWIRDIDEWSLKIYSPEGKLLARFRKGDGPQELPRSGFRAFAAGDTIFAGDFGRGPVKVIDPSLLRVVRIIDRKRPEIDWSILLVGKLDDGRWLVVRRPRDNRWYPRGGGGETPRYERQWVLYEPDFSAGRVLLRYPGAAVRWVSERNHFDRPVFGRMTAQALHGGRIYLATNHAPEIEVRDTAGQVTLRIRVDLPLEPVTAKDREDYVRAKREFFSGGGRSPNRRSFRAELGGNGFRLHALLL